MIYRILADIVVIFHLIFVIFPVIGGLFVLKWRKLIWVHIPVVIWAVVIEFTGFICPLTSLENLLRYKGGQSGYQSDFIEHYIFPLLYPDGLTHTMQIIIGIFVFAVNVIVYSIIIHRIVKHRK
jgi:hypothetical protein